MMKHRLLLVVIATLAAGSAALSGCGDDQASSTTAVSSGGSAASSTPSSSTSSSTSTTAGSNADEGASSNSSSTTTAGGSAGTSDDITTAAVQAVIEGQPWAGQIGKVGVSPGSEQIITVVANDQSVPAVQVCTAVRDAFVADHGDVSVNVWYASAQDPSGEGKQLATALSGSPCEAV
jgi:hypothetical protein